MYLLPEKYKENSLLYFFVDQERLSLKGDLERQVGRISKYCVEKKYHVVDTFDEVGSGMNEDRAKLKRLF